MAKARIIYKVKGFRYVRDLRGQANLVIEKFDYTDINEGETKFLEMVDSRQYYKVEYKMVDTGIYSEMAKDKKSRQ